MQNDKPPTDIRRLLALRIDCRNMMGCDRCGREIQKECMALGGINVWDEKLYEWDKYILRRLNELDKNLLDVPDDDFIQMLG